MVQLQSELLPFKTRNKVRPQFRFVRTTWQLSEKGNYFKLCECKIGWISYLQHGTGEKATDKFWHSVQIGLFSADSQSNRVSISIPWKKKRQEFVIILKAKELLLWGKALFRQRKTRKRKKKTIRRLRDMRRPAILCLVLVVFLGSGLGEGSINFCWPHLSLVLSVTFKVQFKLIGSCCDQVSFPTKPTRSYTWSDILEVVVVEGYFSSEGEV